MSAMNIERQKPRDEAIEKIENFIIHNQLKPGDRLPSERSMCDMWDFNRSTLRSAIKQLILEGKIYNSNFAYRFCLCTLKIQYLAGIRLSKFHFLPYAA